MTRKNKSKKEIVSDIQLVADADRRRALIKDVLFPYLLKLNENIGYTKVFVQAFHGLVDGVFDERRKTTTIGDLTPRIKEKLTEIFKMSDETQKAEFDKYMKLVDILKDISVQDFAYAAELPRFIDGFLLKDKNKEPMDIIDIIKILG